MPTNEPDTLPPAQLAQIQAIVFRAWKGFAYSAFHFVRFSDDPAQARAYVAELRGQIAWADSKEPGLALAGGRELALPIQLALTTNGLWRLGLDGETLDRFPFEAKLGMERRARVIGDPVDVPEAVDEKFFSYEDYAREYDPAEPTKHGKPYPTGWTIDLRRCDAMVILFAKTREDLEALRRECRDRAKRHGASPMLDEIAAPWSDTEPFGFADGVSQPGVKGQPEKAGVPPSPNNDIAAGEILLGYKNEYGELPQSPRVAKGRHAGFDLGKNGSFLVFRKLEQDVDGYWRQFLELGKRWRNQPVSRNGDRIPDDDIDAALWLAARTMGRWPNGNSVVTHPMAEGAALGHDTKNAFVYGDDKDGLRCPVGSHVRRANPRDQRDADDVSSSWKVVKRHRVVRRGRSYGPELRGARASLERLAAQPDLPEPEAASGLLFVCLQANITHGFEFVQQIWNNNPAFHGLYQEPDVIAGPGGARFTIPAEPVRIELKRQTPLPEPEDDAEKKRRRHEDRHGLPKFVTSRGGGYFFVPSRDALDVLVNP